jgi:hypothetical protein
VKIEEVPLPHSERWSSAVFAQNGNELFFTNSDFDGIWTYSFDTKVLKEITREKHSGFAFSVAADGKSVAYRRTMNEGDHVTRRQEAVERNISTGSAIVLERGNSVRTPVFVGTTAVSQRSHLQKLSHTVAPVVLGIEETKISMLINGQQVLLDPMNGQYIWPRLSHDAERLVAVEMDRGALVYSFADDKTQMIGKCNSPSWSSDGEWIIGMDDRDDGHTIYASDIIAVTPDGKSKVNLTDTFDAIALHPSASPVERKVVFNTAEGKIFILNFEEVK